MVRLDRSRLMIILLSIILGVTVIPEVFEQGKAIRSVFREDTESYPALKAPERTVQPLKEGERVCYLTFDDGPNENTIKILDILKEYDVKATFFVVGSELTQKRRGIVERVIEEGHTVGLHANEHIYEKLYASRDSFLRDYETLYKKLKDDYGIETAVFRFPGGSVCSCLHGQGKAYIEEMKMRGFTCFDWNISGEDAVGTPTVASIQKKVLSKGLGCRRAIVLLHDAGMAEKTIEALPGIIEKFKEEGFRFDSLEHAESYIFPASR